MSNCPGKNSWPELVGTNGESAKATIERENRNVGAIVVRDGTIVTGDFRTKRRKVSYISGVFLSKRHSWSTLVAFLPQTPLWRFFDQTPQLVNVSGVFAQNAASLGPNAAKYHILVAFFCPNATVGHVSGVLAPNAASFVVRKQFIETTPFRADRRSPVARRRPPAAVRPSVRTKEINYRIESMKLKDIKVRYVMTFT
ncbi:hypothetical protein GQ457_04G027490 [Hibiscus cannabinus]